MSDAACPCGRTASRKPLAYAQCCGRYIDAFTTTPAPDAESLMRSRYTAYVRENAHYLLATWHVSERPASVDFDSGARWLGLEVRSYKPIDQDHAVVEFVARMRDATGRATRLAERSRFMCENDGELRRWYYVDAI